MWIRDCASVVRLGLDADWDRMEHMANYDTLVRQMLGLPAAPWDESKQFGHQTLRDNGALLDKELIQAINARIDGQDARCSQKRSAPLAVLEIKAVTYVLESDVHFPTDLNLHWDAGRKCVDLVEGLLCPAWLAQKSVFHCSSAILNIIPLFQKREFPARYYPALQQA